MGGRRASDLAGSAPSASPLQPATPAAARPHYAATTGRPPLPRARRIKAAQAEFQALKKISGNTHTARTLVPNRLAALFILTGATFLCASGLNNMMLGRNKIVIKDD